MRTPRPVWDGIGQIYRRLAHDCDAPVVLGVVETMLCSKVRPEYETAGLVPNLGFLVGIANILSMGIYGYFIPENVRIGLQIAMLGTVLSLCLLVVIFRPTSSVASHTSVQWGALSSRGYATLIFLGFVVTWLMGLGGYRRSSMRLYWHITDVMRDQSPWAFTHSIGFATNILSLNALLFWIGIGFIFWMAREKREGNYSSAGVAKEEVCHTNW